MSEIVKGEEAPSQEATVADWEGLYGDTNHPGCPRVIKFTSADAFSISGDDGDASKPWTGSGKLLASGNIVVDLSSKGGPGDLEGRWTGSGICWVREGENAIESDGSANWFVR